MIRFRRLFDGSERQHLPKVVREGQHDELQRRLSPHKAHRCPPTPTPVHPGGGGLSQREQMDTAGYEKNSQSPVGRSRGTAAIALTAAWGGSSRPGPLGGGGEMGGLCGA